MSPGSEDRVRVVMEAIVRHAKLIDRQLQPVKLSMCRSRQAYVISALTFDCKKLFQEFKRLRGTEVKPGYRPFFARCFIIRNKDIVASLHASLQPYVDDEMAQKLFAVWSKHSQNACVQRVGVAVALELCCFAERLCGAN
eukprot:9498-Heterococcus_DN1.PRE.1